MMLWHIGELWGVLASCPAPPSPANDATFSCYNLAASLSCLSLSNWKPPYAQCSRRRPTIPPKDALPPDPLELLELDELLELEPELEGADEP